MCMYKYPRTVSWLLFESAPNHAAIVYNVVTGFEYELSVEQAKLLLRLDGRTDPRDLRGQMSEAELITIIQYFDNEQLIRSSRLYIEESLKLLTLWARDYKTSPKDVTLLYRIITILLNVAWLPLFYYSMPLIESKSCSMTGILVGTVIGSVLHEAGHYIVARWFGVPVFEVCLLMQGVLPGVCVLIDDTQSESRLKRILINAAGIQVNCLVAGFAAGFAFKNLMYSEFLCGVGLSNWLLAVTNALPLPGGTDGRRILQLMFERKNKSTT